MRLVFKALEIEATDANIKSVIKEMDVDRKLILRYFFFSKRTGQYYLGIRG